MRKLGQLFTIRLLVVLLLTGLTVWNACRHHYVSAVFCALALVAAIVWLYKLYHRDAERVRFLLDAVESKDFNFHFASETEWGRDKVVMEVSNTGAPISAELEEHIFIPFFTTKENGSGIGLSISRQIMRMSGGTLTLRTHPQTTFVLTFER